VSVLDPDSGKLLSESRFDVSLAFPGEYVRLTDARFEPPSAANKGNNQLVVTLLAIGHNSGPAIKAELVLPPSRIPGLSEPFDGTLRAELDPKLGQATLMAKGIKLDDRESEHGFCYINIDDYKRAFVLNTTFARRGDATTPRIDLLPNLRVLAKSPVRSGSKYVEVEVDNAPPDATLQLSLGRLELSGFVPERILPPRGPRDRRVRVGLAQGNLALEATLADWSIPMDTEGVSGSLALRAVLAGRDGREIKSAIHRVILDDSAPRDVRIVDLPEQGRRGSQVLARASGKPSESGTKEVNFFWGKPLPDGKLPPNVELIKAEPVDSTRTTWMARLTLPEDKKGMTPLSVQFRSAADVSTFDSRTIELVDIDPSVFGQLRIKVLEGDRLQSGLDVAVLDAKGAVRQQGKTGLDGIYLTGKLEKGEYRVYSFKQATPSEGQSTVSVEPGSTKPVTVDLFYLIRP
jgi:hypothetical protein